MRRLRGFSLIELVIVVVIIGVLGAIAIPRMSRGTEGARTSAFIAELNRYASAIEHYQAAEATRISDTPTGQFPSELSDFLRESNWHSETPIGGFWDTEVDSNGVGVAVGVHFQGVPIDLEDVQEIDRVIDDNDLTTGAFQQLAVDRFYLILEK